jgi:hypothetical protein
MVPPDDEIRRKECLALLSSAYAEPWRQSRPPLEESKSIGPARHRPETRPERLPAMRPVTRRRCHAVDGSTLAVMAGLLTAACLIATWWPARRAAHSNPIAALKQI